MFSVSQYWWYRRYRQLESLDEEDIPQTYNEAEWDMYVSRLLGKSIRATTEDLEVLKNLCKKLGA